MADNLPEFKAELDPETRYARVPPQVLEAHGRIYSSDAARQFKVNDHLFRQACQKLGIEIDEHDTVAEKDLNSKRAEFKKAADKIFKVAKGLAQPDE